MSTSGPSASWPGRLVRDLATRYGRCQERLRAWRLGLPARAADPFATHLPVLVGLARLAGLRRILEFGAGRCSTLAYGDRGSFPDLVAVDSYEDDATWLRQIAAALPETSCVRLHLHSGDFATLATRLDVSPYDLIFVDNSMDWQQRVATIAALGARRIAVPVLIHDFEFPAYRAAAEAFEHRCFFNALNPASGLVWNGNRPWGAPLPELNLAIRRQSRHLKHSDHAAWSKYFATVLARAPALHESNPC